ncbi:MAG: rubredoxin [Methylococcaceae bacterium]|nr:rubredoxin [Methylococcaceae bacterium]
MKTICIPCGYIYDGNEPFQSLPKTWCCPDCGGSIMSFAEIDESLPKKVHDILDDPTL